MPKHSAGLLPFKLKESPSGQLLELLLVHPGGPFWAKKDQGSWSIAKGEYDPEETSDPMEVATREFLEEIGQPIPEGTWIPLGEVKQPSGKRITAWAVECDLDVSRVDSNTFEVEWPTKSGKLQSFPEVDRAEWFSIAEARLKILKGQLSFVELLINEMRSIRGIEFEEGEVEDSKPEGTLF